MHNNFRKNLNLQSLTPRCPKEFSIFAEFDGKRVLVTRPEEVAELVPLERLGTPQDIAAAVSFLAGLDGS
jgi:3-oxoacyl-[acyl-carrier protein] reductase